MGKWMLGLDCKRIKGGVSRWGGLSLGIFWDFCGKVKRLPKIEAGCQLQLRRKKCFCVVKLRIISILIVFRQHSSVYFQKFRKHICLHNRAPSLLYLQMGSSLTLIFHFHSSTRPHSWLHIWILPRNRRKSETNLLTFHHPYACIPTPTFTATTNIKASLVPFFLHLAFLGTESKQGALQFGVIGGVAILLKVEQHVLAALLIEGNGVFEVVLRF